jgi:hypothetical protein
MSSLHACRGSHHNGPRVTRPEHRRSAAVQPFARSQARHDVVRDGGYASFRAPWRRRERRARRPSDPQRRRTLLCGGPRRVDLRLLHDGSKLDMRRHPLPLRRACTIIASPLRSNRRRRRPDVCRRRPSARGRSRRKHRPRATVRAHSSSRHMGRRPLANARRRRLDRAREPKCLGEVLGHSDLTEPRGGASLVEDVARLDPPGRKPADEKGARALRDLRRFLAAREG